MPYSTDPRAMSSTTDRRRIPIVQVTVFAVMPPKHKQTRMVGLEWYREETQPPQV
jgi:hypothetical protein